MKLYRQIVNILCYKKIRGEIENVLKKVENNEICLLPKMIDNKQSINLHEVIVEEDDDEFFSSSDDEQFSMMLELGQNVDIEMGEESEIKEKDKTKKPKEQKKSINKRKPSSLFTYTLTRIIRHILGVIDQTSSVYEKNEEKMKEEKSV